MGPADPARAALEGLRDELRLTREALARMAAEATSAAQQFADTLADNVSLYGCGALVHAYYTALERFLQAASREFNSEPAHGPAWHRRLLVASSSDRPGRRPPIVSAATIEGLDRFLRFRHLFRNLYVFQLEWGEIRPLLLELAAVHARVDANLAVFDAFLASLIAVPPEA